MPDKSISLLIQAGVPGVLAALMQLAMALAIGRIPPVAQMIGAVLVSGLVGGATSVLLVEVLHWAPVISGTVAAMTGAIPAIRWATVANKALEKQLKDKFDLDVEQQKEDGETP